MTRQAYDFPALRHAAEDAPNSRLEYACAWRGPNSVGHVNVIAADAFDAERKARRIARMTLENPTAEIDVDVNLVRVIR